MVNKLNSNNSKKIDYSKLERKYWKIIRRLFSMILDVLWEEHKKDNVPTEVIKYILKASIPGSEKITKQEAKRLIGNYQEPIDDFVNILIDLCSKSSYFKRNVNFNELILLLNHELNYHYTDKRKEEIENTFKSKNIWKLLTETLDSFEKSKNADNIYYVAMYLDNDILDFLISPARWWLDAMKIKSDEEVLWLIDKNILYFIEEYEKDYWCFSDKCEKIIVTDKKWIIDIFREQLIVRLSTILLEDEIYKTIEDEKFTELDSNTKEWIKEILEDCIVYLNNMVQNDKLRELYDWFKINKWIITIYLAWKRTEKRPYIKAIEDKNFKKYLLSIREQSWYQIRFKFI
jgi:hypothetical protein